MTPRRGLLLAVALAVALAASACAPVATFTRDLIERSDGATLEYVFRSDDELPGLRYDPAGELALAVILVARGADLEILAIPEGASCALNDAATIVDCRLGDRSEPVIVNLRGRNVTAWATWRRSGSTTVLSVFVR
jgi:hypothetical protein